jgi:hypothetical protein
MKTPRRDTRALQLLQSFVDEQQSARRDQARALLAFAAATDPDIRATRQLLNAVANDAHRARHGAVYPAHWLRRPKRIHPPRSLSRSVLRIREIQAGLRTALDMLVPVISTSDGSERPTTTAAWRVPARRRDVFLIRDVSSPWVRRVEVAQWGEDLLWLAIAALLAEFGAEIRRCVVCRTCFLGERQTREFCSNRCSARRRFTRWYQANRNKILKRRHQAYVKRRQKTQPRAKVERRARR